MRKLLSTTAGASFHEESPTFTINVRKEAIELIYKLAPSWYVIVNAVRMTEDEILLFCEWGHYFDRIKNPAVQIPRVEKCCPTLYGIFKGTDPDGVFDMFSGDRNQTESHVFGFRIKAPNDGPMVECITHDVVKAGLKLANKNLKVYRELFENPPFPAWKDGLKELWN